MKFFSVLKNSFCVLIKNPTLINVFIVGSMTLLVKAMGFFKEMQVGRVFGLSELIDTFLIASLIPGFINNVFMASFQNVFIPNYIAETKKTNNIGSFLSACVIITFCLGIVLSIGSYMFTVFFLEDIFKGHSLMYYNLIRSQFYILLPCILFWSFSSLFGGLLEIKGFFSFSAIYPIITSIVFLVCLFFFRNLLGFEILAFSLLLGSFLEFVYLLWISIYKKTLQLSKPDFSSPNIIALYRQLPSKIGSGLLTGSTGFVNQFFAAQLVVGSIAAFNYGLKIPSFVASILIISIGNVLLPYFSNLVYDDRLKAYKVLYKSILYVFLFSVLIAGVFYIFSEDIISILFEKGSFTSNDTQVVSKLQKILLVYIPFYISSMIIIKFLTSINKNAYMFYASILNLVLNLVLNYYFVKMYNINGLAMATTIVYIVNFVVLFVFVNHQRKIDSLR
jgi:putative peptidoglycan lipid II flippase